MAVITGYTSLQTAIGDWLARSDLTSFIPNFIQNWEEKFYRNPDNHGRWMETDFSDAIASSVIAVPSDYLKLKYAYIDNSPSARLDRVSVNQLYGRYPRGGGTGFPEWIARDASSFVFGPEPDSNYTVKGVYWAKPTLLRNYASDAAAHFIITNAPDLPLYGALIESAPFLRRDDRLPVWQAMYAAAEASYQDLIKDEDESGSPVQEVLG